MDAKIFVCLSFDFDALSLWIGGFQARSLSAVSRGEFGRVGATRILNLLRDREVPATWFVPGHSAETFPRIVERIAAEGHELGNHGYLHTHPKSPEDEEQILLRGNAALRKIAGIRPIGYRSPGAGLSESMVRLLVKYGFVYDSSLMGDDFTPYFLRAGDRAPATGPYRFGKPTSVVEIPFSWSLDDFPAFEYVTSRAGIQPGLKSPETVYQIWAGDFDYLAHRVGAGVFTLTMHPQVIGRGHRMLMLEKLIDHIRAHRAVQFVTMGAAATAFKRGSVNPA